VPPRTVYEPSTKPWTVTDKIQLIINMRNESRQRETGSGNTVFSVHAQLYK